MALTSTVALAGAGTAIAPGVGTAIGAGLGFIIDMFGAGNASEAKQLQYGATALDYKTKANEAGVQILQTKSDISAYEEYLKAFPNYADLQKSTFEASARADYSQMLNNLGLQDVAAGASGRSGASVQAAGGQAKSELVDFAGADLALGGGDGGRYEMGKSELWNNLDLEQKKAAGQIDIFKTTLSVLQENKGLYEQGAADYTAKAADTGLFGESGFLASLFG